MTQLFDQICKMNPHLKIIGSRFKNYWFEDSWQVLKIAYLTCHPHLSGIAICVVCCI